jgi:quercetin dioxygenase-like cupin family protein
MSDHDTQTGWTNFVQGGHRRVLADGQQLMLIKVYLEAGAVVAEHSHIHEQITYVLNGQVRFTIAGKEQVLGAGESVLLSSNVPHSVTALENTSLLDAFSPPREDFR